LIKTIGCILFLIFLISCKRVSGTGESNILNVPLTREVSTFDPALSYDTVSMKVLYQSYEPLYEYHYGKRPYTVVPLLADSMPEISKNQLEYTIKLKPNVYYHDKAPFGGKNREVRSEDFLNQFKRIAYAPLKSPGRWLFEGKIEGMEEFRQRVGDDFSKFFETPISGIKTPDPQTLVIKLTHPFPQLLSALTMTFAIPLPKEAITYYKNDFSKTMFGTGPFQLVKSDSKEILLHRFEDYHPSYFPSQGDRFANENNLLKDAGKKIPFIFGVHFFIEKDTQKVWNLFKEKKLDLFVLDKNNFPNALEKNGELKKELNDQGARLQISPGVTFRMLAFNMKDPIVGKHENLRRAIAHAINWDEYISIFTNNVVQKANSIYLPGMAGYNPSKELGYSYDPEMAAQFLQKAGFPKGKGLPALQFDLREDSSEAFAKAEYIQKSLAQLGIKIDIIPNTFPDFIHKSFAGTLQFWEAGWTLDYPDAENILQLLITKTHPPGVNAAWYSNPYFDRLYNKLARLENGPEKYNIMEKMERMVLNDLPWIMQYYLREYVIYWDHLKNYRHSDLIFSTYKYARLEKTL